MSPLFEAIGLGGLDLGIVCLILFIAVIALAVMTAVLSKRLKDLTVRYDRFMRGSSAKSLEQDIDRIYEDNINLKKAMHAEQESIDDIYYRLETMLQRVGIIKYDAFHQMGGKLSYALALLDQRDNGFVLNSVHSVDGCYTYVKQIKRGRSDVDLGKEEQIALNRALGVLEENIEGGKSHD